MHLLLIPSWYPASANDIRGGFFREQALALRKHGYEVGVIYPELAGLRYPKTWPIALRPDEFTVDEGIPTYRSYGLDWLPGALSASADLWIRKGMRMFDRYALENGQPDVLHAHSMFNGGLLAQRIASKYGIPYVITEHNTAFARGLIRKWQKELGTIAVRSAAARIAVSAEFAAFLDGFYDQPESSWTYVPNIVAEAFAKQPLQDRELRSGTEFTFCSVALLTKKKGIDILLRAFSRSFADRPDTKLIVGGDGEERSQLEVLTAELGLGGQVTFLGNLERKQVLDVISRSDAFVLSSHFETFGVVLVEALALGKPVLATRCGGPESIVMPSDGLLVEKGNIEALSAGLRQLRERAFEYDSEAIRSACLERFGENAVVEQLSGVYENTVTRWQQDNG